MVASFFRTEGEKNLFMLWRQQHLLLSANIFNNHINQINPNRSPFSKTWKIIEVWSIFSPTICFLYGWIWTPSELDLNVLLPFPNRSRPKVKISPTRLLVYVWKVKTRNKKNLPTEIGGRMSPLNSPKRKRGARIHLHRLFQYVSFLVPSQETFKTSTYKNTSISAWEQSAQHSACCKTGNRLLFLNNVYQQGTHILGRKNRRGLWVTQLCFSLNGLMGSRTVL